MTPDFITDLDDYFCKTYSDKTKLAAIPGFVQPIATEAEGFVEDPERYKLCRQKNPSELLAAFKRGLIDRDFSFTFAEVSFKQRLADWKRKNAFYKLLPAVFQKYSLDLNAFDRELNISEGIWKKIVKGRFYPSKNLILAIALTGGLDEKDTVLLLDSCEYTLDTASVRDTVVSYLLTYGIYNASLAQAALREYKITCLPLKEA